MDNRTPQDVFFGTRDGWAWGDGVSRETCDKVQGTVLTEVPSGLDHYAVPGIVLSCAGLVWPKSGCLGSMFP